MGKGRTEPCASRRLLTGARVNPPAAEAETERECLAMDIAYGTDFHSLAVSKIQVCVHLSEMQERDGPSHSGQGHALSRLVQKVSKDHGRLYRDLGLRVGRG